MSQSAEHVLIVGGGQGASELAAQLRMQMFGGAITVICAENSPPYQRPPLSKAFLAGESSIEDLLCRPISAYERVDVRLLLGQAVVAVDRPAHRVTLTDGSDVPYDRLVIATGGRARRPVDAEADGIYRAPNVHELRTLSDATRLHEALLSGKRLAIIGGGYVGLEVAATASRLGVAVTVLEALPRVLARVTAPIVSTFYADVHRTAGVDVRTSTRVVDYAVGGDGAVRALRLDDGSTVTADVVLIGVGMVPNVEIAEAAGIPVQDGILVDEHSRTEDPDVFAVGDCANHPNVHAGRRVRLESVPNALEQARSAAAALTGGSRPYTAVPWFWSDQYDVKLQTAGLSAGHDLVVVRGAPASRSFLVAYLKGGHLIAADAISRPREFAQARRLIGRGVVVDPEALGDESVPLTEAAGLPSGGAS